MSAQEYIEKMKKSQEFLLEYITKEDNEEENYQNLINLFHEQKINNNRLDLKTILYLIAKISNNHNRCAHFISKIERVIQIFKDSIKKYFTNFEIFKIFKSNKRVLLFLIHDDIMSFEKTIILEMIQDKLNDQKYPEYFAPEIIPLIDDEIKQKYFVRQNNSRRNEGKNSLDERLANAKTDNFEEKRNIGENDDIISEIIRKDMIEEFIVYINKKSYPINSYIKESIFETNPFLLKNKETTLIEYSAFFGSAQIFKYLYDHEVKFGHRLWLYGIHGDNPEIIHIIDENEVLLPELKYQLFIKESIKCHHNHIVNYIINNKIGSDSVIYNDIDFENQFDENIYSYCFHYYNFAFFSQLLENIYILCYACKYDYYQIVEYFISRSLININMSIIFHVIFSCYFQN